MTASHAKTADNASPPEAEGWPTLKRFLPYLWPRDNWPLRRRIVIAMTFVLFAKAVTLTLPFAYAGAVDAMSGEGLVDEAVLVAFALVASYALGRFTQVAFDNIRNMAFERVEQEAVLSLSEDVFHRLHRLSLRFHLSRRTGEVAKVIALIRPAVQSDGGDLELVEVTDEGVVRVRLHGACVGCPSSSITLKMGIDTLPEGRIERITSISHHVAELMNQQLDHAQPYAGRSAFAHKAGLHTSAIARRADSYEHVDPAAVGNSTRFLVSDLSGRATVELKAAELGVELDGAAASRVTDELKRLEHEGFHFETADGSLELLLREATGWEQDFFDIESFRVVTDRRVDRTFDTEATVKVRVGDDRMVAVGEGNGPVDSLDAALRQAIGSYYPQLERVHLTDYKVRILDSEKATGAVTRVLIDSTAGDRTWTTIGVSENIIEASWQALRDSIVYALLHLSTEQSEPKES